MTADPNAVLLTTSNVKTLVAGLQAELGGATLGTASERSALSSYETAVNSYIAAGADTALLAALNAEHSAFARLDSVLASYGVSTNLSLSGAPLVGTQGSAYSFTPTTGGGNAPYTYSYSGTLQAGLSFNTATGAITGTPTASGTQSITITVTDAAANTANLTISLQINAAGTPTNTTPPSISGSAVQGATLTTSPGAWTNSPTISSQWYRDNTSTPISGANSTSYVIQAADVGHTLIYGETASPGGNQAFSSATATVTGMSISGTPVTTATVGTTYTGFTVSASGGTAPYTYSIASGSLPAGISLNASTGAVTGTPTAPGNFTGIVIRATDSSGAHLTADLASFAIRVTQVYDFSAGSLPSGWSVTRAGTAKAWNSSGNLADVSANTPRWSYDPTSVGHALKGLLIRPALTNLAPNPNSFGSWSIFNATLGSTTTGPDGVSGSGQAVTNTGYFGLFEGVSFTSGHKYSLSVFNAWTSGDKRSALVINGALTGQSRDVGYAFDASTGLAASQYDTGGANGGPFTSPDPSLSGSSSMLSTNGWAWGRIDFTSVASTTTNIAPFWNAAGVYAIADVMLVDWGTGTAGVLYPEDYTPTSTSADQLTATLPSGVSQAVVTFDDNSTQTVTGLTGGSSWTVPTNLNRPWIKQIAVS